MSNININADEVILCTVTATSRDFGGNVCATVTSQKLAFECETTDGQTIIEEIALEDVKLYNGVVQIKQRLNYVDVQTIPKNFTLTFANVLDARKFVGKAVDAVTGTTFSKRSSEKVKNALNMVDDTLGIDSRATLKGAIEKSLSNKGSSKSIISIQGKNKQ